MTVALRGEIQSTYAEKSFRVDKKKVGGRKLKVLTIPGIELRIERILDLVARQCGMPNISLSHQTKVIDVFPCFLSVPFPNVSVVL